MTNDPTPTLLSKARSFIGKSAVIAIAPLAMVQVADAATTFGVPGSSSGGFGFGFVSGGSEFFSETNFSASALPTINSINGVRISVSGNFGTSGGSGVGTFVLVLGGGSISGTPLGAGSNIPVSYNFTLSKDGGSSVTSWVLDFGLGPNAATPSSVGGVGYGLHEGTATLITGASSTSYYQTLTINVSDFGASDTLTVDMTGEGRGVSLNAVPEPSTSALVAGCGIFALLGIRRRPLREVG